MAALFTYGSLMFPAVWSRVVVGRYVPQVATVHGFCRLAVKGETYPAAIPCPDQQIAGVLYTGITAADLLRLDRFEGSQYWRRPVRVDLDSGKFCPAYIYLLRPSHYHLLASHPWDEAAFRHSGLPQFLRQYAGFS